MPCDVVNQIGKRADTTNVKGAIMGYFDKFNKGKGIPFMEDKTKFDVPLGEDLTIVDYGFIQGEDAPYAVLLFAEYPENFAFGNSIISDDIAQMEKDLGEKANVLNALKGVKVKFTKIASKKNPKREYTAVEFIEL